MVEALSPQEEDLWRTFARLMVVVPRALEDRMLRETGLITTTYLVLMHLSESPGRSLRMHDLALRAAMSPSRMTRIVDGLERDGYVTRALSAEDRRVSIATLTPAGLRLLRKAWPLHLKAARELVVDKVERAELPPVTALLHRILDGLGCDEAAAGGCGPPPCP